MKHEVLEEKKKGREEKEMHVEEEDKSPPNTQDCIVTEKNYAETGPLYDSFCAAICNQELCIFIINSGDKIRLQNALA